MFGRFFRALWDAVVQLAEEFRFRLFPPGPQVSRLIPSNGWGGTLIEVEGAHFDAERDGNQVTVGGWPAVVVRAASDRLQILTHRQTASGRVGVTVAGRTGTSADDFTVLPHPDQGDLTQAGPPRTFVGPVPGTPRAKGLNQPILAILVYPNDHDPGTPAERARKRDEQIERFNLVNRFYGEASYGATSFDFAVTDWLALPEARDHYVWQTDDILRTRRDLYQRTQLGVVVVGDSVYLAHRGAGLAIVNIDDPDAPEFVGTRGFLQPATVVRVADGRAYVGVGGTGIHVRVHVIDVAAPEAPVELGNVELPGWIADLDRLDDILYIAAEEAGMRVVDVADPAAPTEIGSVALAGWAMGIRVAGAHAYVAAGDAGLVIVDITIAANPVVVGALGLDGFAVAIDLSGDTAFIATDGDGVKIIDVTNPRAPVPISTDRTVLRPRGLTVDGHRLYVAGADQGLHIIDVAQAVAPAALGRVDVTPALAVAVVGNAAYVALGSGTLQVVAVDDPEHPAVRGSYNAAPFIDVDVQTLRDAARVAQDEQGFLQLYDAFLFHSFTAAQDAGFDLQRFEGFICVVHGPFLRGQSWTDTGVAFDGNAIDFGGTKGIVYLAHDATWARRAHEIGHWFGLHDIYQEYDADGTYTLGTAGPWDMMGTTDAGLLFSGHHIHDRLGYYTSIEFPPDDPRNKVAKREWTLGGDPVDETFEIVAHGENEDPAGSGKVHLLRLEVAEGLVYYVEVRQRPSLMGNPVIFDATIPVPVDAAHPWLGGVIVTKALDNNNHGNMRERSITLVGDSVLDVGDEVIDAARRLRIHVEERTNDWPLTYRVRLEWNQPVGNDPDGRFDLHITPWNTDNWETADIWVDSPRNNPGGAVQYEFHQEDPEDEAIPRLNGDRPWVHHENTIHARVRNDGVEPAEDVFVSFYTNSPPGIGDNGSWVLRETKRIDRIAAGGNAVASALWIPSEGEHTCLKVEIAARIGEISVENNSAQENVFTFDSASSSSHRPVILDTVVRNPFPRWQLVHLQVRGLPVGWFAVVDHGWLWLPPHAQKPLTLVIWTIKGTSEEHTDQIVPATALVRVEGWTTQMHRLLPIGGLLVIVTANTQVRIDWDISAPSLGSVLGVSGCVDPPLSDVPIVIEIVDPRGKRQLLHTQTDNQGCFRTSGLRRRQEYVPPYEGRYKVQVFTAAGGDAAQTESEVKYFSLNA